MMLDNLNVKIDYGSTFNVLLKIKTEIGQVATTLAQQTMQNAILESHWEII